ncbi:hypothetical protein PoB_007148300 [Plakobranchus ocellatus]|uniref:Uncharacterized protein n=1 Tax=Plakobranchus ocellatus TaxID=259542 RepID=A0AAV4DLQ6_9GAST|nr:hypothetical protein PoB_007148300 [Plakobranchus ocellatus]
METRFNDSKKLSSTGWLLVKLQPFWTVCLDLGVSKSSHFREYCRVECHFSVLAWTHLRFAPILNVSWLFEHSLGFGQFCA